MNVIAAFCTIANSPKNCTFYPYCMYFVFISKPTANSALHNTNLHVYITEMKSVYCAVRTGLSSKNIDALSLGGKLLLNELWDRDFVQSDSMEINYFNQIEGIVKLHDLKLSVSASNIGLCFTQNFRLPNVTRTALYGNRLTDAVCFIVLFQRRRNVLDLLQVDCRFSTCKYNEPPT
jgi:hypothetical protein